MNHPDKALPEAQLSLKQFVAIAQCLLSNEENPDAFVCFVLAGCYERMDGQTCIFVNAKQGAAAPPNGEYQQ
jgi:hypothetical protein